MFPLWKRFWAKVDTSGGADACWPWTGARSKKRNGKHGHTYRGVIQVAGRGSRIVLVHRFVLCLVHGGPDLDELLADYDATFRDGSLREAAHSCNNRLCCNPTHLRWATEQDNRDDRYENEIVDYLDKLKATSYDQSGNQPQSME